MRTGLGIDSHRFAPGRRLVLGGVEIPHDRGLDGHSDADVLAHAITDAILGAASMGDIGTHFPDTEERWRGADSIELLREIVRRGKESGAQVLLLGMMIPPNYGRDYTERFRNMYPEIADEFDVPLLPFLLEDVGGIANLNQADGIHPNPAGVKIIVGKMLAVVEQLVHLVKR